MLDLLRSVRRKFFERKVLTPRFKAAVDKLKQGDVVIDCGANVGVYAEIFARTGATVHALEPDPVAFERLRERLSAHRNVICHNAAASTEEGTARLYMHVDRDDDPVTKSQSSSLLADKSNVDPSRYTDVPTIDFAQFVESLGQVKMLKMDIEGAEIEVLNHVLDRGADARIETAFVELHDRKNPALIEPTRKLRKRIEACSMDADLSWH
jgi:FkbM family methyltransferase